MNRKKLESLPRAGQDVIRKYSGEWLAARAVDAIEPYTAALFEQLKSDPLRTVVFPTQSEIDVAEEAFRAVRTEWANASPQHRLLLSAVEAEILKFRAEQ
jgi:TRAP-type C4-dicarboxylate transport system substrate-binding protein